MTTDELVARIGECDGGPDEPITLINRIAQAAVRWRESDIAYSRQSRVGRDDFLSLVMAHEMLDAAILDLARRLETP